MREVILCHDTMMLLILNFLSRQKEAVTVNRHEGKHLRAFSTFRMKNKELRGRDKTVVISDWLLGNNSD